MSKVYKTLQELNIQVHNLLKLKNEGILDTSICEELFEAYKQIATTWINKGDHSESGQAYDILHAIFKLQEK